MDSLNGKHAVITGGASGMGKAFAKRFLDAGMRVTIGDIEEPVLDEAVEELGGSDRVLGVATDVSDDASMRAFHAAAEDRFGPADVLCLNAGVAGGTGPMDKLTLADWQWVIGVNLYGIINGLREFLGPMKARDEGHIVITASIAGLTSFPSMGPYNLTKHGAVSIAETLLNELHDEQSNLGVTCLCPGLVLTGIFQSERNRPEKYVAPGIPDEPSMDEEEMAAAIEVIASVAKPPEHVADLIHDAVLSNTFWVFTDGDFDPQVRARLDAIAAGRPPLTSDTLLSNYM